MVLPYQVFKDLQTGTVGQGLGKAALRALQGVANTQEFKLAFESTKRKKRMEEAQAKSAEAQAAMREQQTKEFMDPMAIAQRQENMKTATEMAKIQKDLAAGKLAVFDVDTQQAINSATANMRQWQAQEAEYSAGMARNKYSYMDLDRAYSVRRKQLDEDIGRITKAMKTDQFRDASPEIQGSMRNLDYRLKQARLSLMGAQLTNEKNKPIKGIKAAPELPVNKQPLAAWHDVLDDLTRRAENETGIKLSSPDFVARYKGDASKLQALADQRNVPIRREINDAFEGYAHMMQAVWGPVVGENALEKMGMKPGTYERAGVTPETLRQFFPDHYKSKAEEKATINQALAATDGVYKQILGKNPKTWQEATEMMDAYFTAAEKQGGSTVDRRLLQRKINEQFMPAPAVEPVSEIERETKRAAEEPGAPKALAELEVRKAEERKAAAEMEAKEKEKQRGVDLISSAQEMAIKFWSTYNRQYGKLSDPKATAYSWFQKFYEKSISEWKSKYDDTPTDEEVRKMFDEFWTAIMTKKAESEAGAYGEF